MMDIEKYHPPWVSMGNRCGHRSEEMKIKKQKLVTLREESSNVILFFNTSRMKYFEGNGDVKKINKHNNNNR